MFIKKLLKKSRRVRRLSNGPGAGKCCYVRCETNRPSGPMGELYGTYVMALCGQNRETVDVTVRCAHAYTAGL